MIRRFLYAISAGLLVALPIVSFVSSSASAMSEYDFTLRTTTQLNLPYGSGFETPRDVSTSYLRLIEENLPENPYHQSCYADYINSIDLDNSNWSIMNNFNDPWAGVVRIQLVVSDTAYTTFYKDWGKRVFGIEPSSYGDTSKVINMTLASKNEQGDFDATCDNTSGVVFPVFTSDEIVSIKDSRFLFLSTFPVVYPEGYDGQPVPDSWSPPSGDAICPTYQIIVTAEGLLRVIYQKNITPFLTGINYIVVNETTDDWQTLGVEVMNDSTNPAGWTNWSGDVLLAPNQHYLIRISHNQQLDSPPWTTNPRVQNVWVQILYNGSTPYTFTTSGCDSAITNPITKEENPYVSIFEKLSLSNDEFGLGSIVTAPLTFIAELPSKASSCTPISLPLPYVSSSISLPCMTPIYQSNFNTILTLYQSLMIGLFGYYAAIKIYGNMKQLKDPKDDQIEVINL